MTDEEYQKIFWPQLQEALNILLLNGAPSTEDNNTVSSTAGTPCQRISFEQMYSAVYKCVCKQYSERLYNDLMCHVAQILQRYFCLRVIIPGLCGNIYACKQMNKRLIKSILTFFVQME